MTSLSLIALWLTLGLPLLLLTWVVFTDHTIRRPLRITIAIVPFALFAVVPAGLLLYSFEHPSVTYTPGNLSPFSWLAAREHRLLVRSLTDAPTPRGERRDSLLWRDEQGGLLHCVNGSAEPVLAYNVTRIEYRQTQTFVQALLNDDPDVGEIVTVRVSFKAGEESDFQVRRSKIGLVLGPLVLAQDYGYPDRIVALTNDSRTNRFSCLTADKPRINRNSSEESPP